jgi:hypothetical protein
MLAIASLVLAAPARGQTAPDSSGVASVAPAHLRIDTSHLFASEPHRFLTESADAGDGEEPFVPFEPLLEHLPLRIIPELLRTEDRLTIRWQGYEVKPHVDMHQVEILITRRLSS